MAQGKCKITILGTGTCQIQKHRMASSVLVEFGSLRIVYDFGRGICQRLAELNLGQNDICHIILSHFHPDHISDLIPFLHAGTWSKINPRDKDLNIYGPQGAKQQIIKLINIFEVGDLTCDRFEVKVHDIVDGRFSIDEQVFSPVGLPPLNNLGLKFSFAGKVYAFTGDSDFHKKEIEFLKGVDFALVNVRHLRDNEIVELASLSKAKLMVCSHLYRALDQERLNLLSEKKGYRGRLIVAKDLMTFDF